MVINVFFLKLPEKEKKNYYKEVHNILVTDAVKTIFEYLLQIPYFWKFFTVFFFSGN